MKKNYLKKGSILFGAFLMLNFFTACNREAVQEENSVEATATNVEDEEVTDELAMDTGSDCDQFLEDYESYIDDYIELTKKVKEDPTDATVMTEYSAMAAKASTWDKDVVACQDDAEFVSKYTKLSASLAKKMAAAQ